MFDPGLEIGQIIKNADIVEIFKCGNMGGMRRSRTTNTLIYLLRKNRACEQAIHRCAAR